MKLHIKRNYSEKLFAGAYSKKFKTNRFAPGRNLRQPSFFEVAYSKKLFVGAHSKKVFDVAYSKKVFEVAYSKKLFEVAYSKKLFEIAYSKKLFAVAYSKKFKTNRFAPESNLRMKV